MTLIGGRVDVGGTRMENGPPFVMPGHRYIFFLQAVEATSAMTSWRPPPEVTDDGHVLGSRGQARPDDFAANAPTYVTLLADAGMRGGRGGNRMIRSPNSVAATTGAPRRALGRARYGQTIAANSMQVRCPGASWVAARFT